MKHLTGLIGSKTLNKKEQQSINGGNGFCDRFPSNPLCDPRDTDNSDNANQ
ncbi:hypothetical protein [Aquimarina atlantica]|uniref:hypothetical protein n=1 Tax=Aquimarina atlantica TaxID=1317122 RepID=UPI000A853EA5|nr:hypothetical protein [Aquimarina atlantica]